MYFDYFGITETPFAITPDPKYLYLSRRHEEALAHLLYGLNEGGGFVVLTGEVGTGKTTICRYLLERLPENVDLALILNPKLNEIELLATVCDELRIDYDWETPTIKDLVDTLNEHLLEMNAVGRRPVLLIDEAQNLSQGVLEQIRLLTNLETAKRKLLQIILVGQPELNETLALKEMRQLAERVTAHYHLQPLSKPETVDYITHRLSVADMSPELFTAEAMTEIHRLSSGVPRRINILCDRSLLAAYVQERQSIDRHLVRRAHKDVRSVSGASFFADRSPIFWLALGCLAAALFIGSAFLAADLIREEAPRAGGGTAPIVAAPQPTDQALLAADAGGQGGDGSDRNDKGPAHRIGTEETVSTQPSEVPAENVLPGPVEQQPEAAVDVAAGVEAAVDPAQAALLAMPVDQYIKEVPGEMETALENLFGMWHQNYGELGGLFPCEKAMEAKLRCLEGRGGLGELIKLNRPALISLSLEQGKKSHGVLVRLDDGSTVVHIGKRRVTLPPGRLGEMWDGGYLMLWKPPPGYTEDVRPGMAAPHIVWLKQSLANVTDYDPGNKPTENYDEALAQAVVSFQQAEGLETDGIAGPMTLILLNTKSGNTLIPKLLETR